MSEDLIKRSREIFNEAVLTYKPLAIVLMFSGGDDSLLTYHVARRIGIKFDLVIHGNTRTGIQDTTDFARKIVEDFGDKYVEADAGDSYINYVTRKGFFGKGIGAHAFSYHILKSGHFRRVTSQHIRQRKRNFPILFINGARQQESENRMITMASPFNPDRTQPLNIWVNLVNHFPNHSVVDYLDGEGIKRNPVSVKLCRSGECMCGTVQSEGDRAEASYYFPKWGQWLNELDSHIKGLHGWGWNDKGPQKKSKTQTMLELVDQPMCTGCKIDYSKSQQTLFSLTPPVKEGENNK